MPGLHKSNMHTVMELEIISWAVHGKENNYLTMQLREGQIRSRLIHIPRDLPYRVHEDW